MNCGRLYITGASGTGTTTLGRAVANVWSVPHADTDDYFWEPTVPPFRLKRPKLERLQLMEAIFAARDAWVLSGSVEGWGDPLVDRFDGVVFLTLDSSIRMARLIARERVRYGASFEAGGPRDQALGDFLKWAASYDDPNFHGRSRKRHEEWLSKLPVPVLTLDSSQPLTVLLSSVLSWNPEPPRRAVG